MGGFISHEYHYFANIGDEILKSCLKCGHIEKIETDSLNDECSKCFSTNLKTNHAIEVGHTFYLGNTYTKQQNANYLQQNGKPATLEMGCHGIGITRLIAASIEALSTDDEIRWPKMLAPFSICIIPPKKSSKEETVTASHMDELTNCLNKIDQLKNDVVIDDRGKFTIGKRLFEAKR